MINLSAILRAHFVTSYSPIEMNCNLLDCVLTKHFNKIRRFSLLIAIALVSFTMIRESSSQQDVNGWFWLNGQPQGNSLNWVQVLDGGDFYAAGDNGVFMKSTDDGNSWTLIQAGALDLSSQGGLGRMDIQTGWFMNSDTGFVAGAPQTGPPNNKTIVSKTTDGGNTWTFKEVNSSAGGVVNEIHFINSTTGFLCGGANARLYRTTDQGETWTSIVSVPAFTYNCIYAFDKNNIFLGTSSRRIVKTTDGGTTWGIDTLFSAVTFVSFLDMTFKDANTGYVTGNPNYFAYTTNGGSSWIASTHSSIYGQRSLIYDAGKIWTAGAYEYVYFSTNDGMNWDSVRFYDNSNVNQPSPFIMNDIGVKGNDLAVVGESGQLTISDDGGNKWSNRNYSVGPTLYSCIYVDSKNGNMWVGPFSGGGSMLFSSNGGTNWTTQVTSHTTSVYDIDFVDSNTGFICGGSTIGSIGQMSYTTNGGDNWNSIVLPTPVNSYQLSTLDFLNPNTGWTGGIQSAFTPAFLAKTTNGGASWNTQTLETNPNGEVRRVHMINENTGYVLANTLYKTTDGGNNWLRNNSSYLTGVSLIDMYVLDENVVFLSGFGSGGVKKVSRTTDGGATFSDISSNLLSSVYIYRTKWMDLNHGVAGGTNGFTATTTNGGANWTQSNAGFSTIVDLAYPNHKVWFAVSDRNGAYQIGRKYESALPPTNPVASFYQIEIATDTLGTTVLTDWGEIVLVYETSLTGRYLNLAVDAPGLATSWQIENAYLPPYDSIFIDTALFAFDIGQTGIPVSGINFGLAISPDTLDAPPSVISNSGVGIKLQAIFNGISDTDLVEPPEILDSEAFKGGKVDTARTYVIPPKVLSNAECKYNECVPAAVHNSLNYLESRGSIEFPVVPQGSPDPFSIEQLRKAMNWTKESGVKIKNWINGKSTIKGNEAKADKKDLFPGKTNLLQRSGLPMRTREFRIEEDTQQNEEILNTVLNELRDGQNIEVIVQKGNRNFGHGVMLTGICKLVDGSWELRTMDDSKQSSTGGQQNGWTNIKTDRAKNQIQEGILKKHFTHLHSFVIECPSTNNIIAAQTSPADNDTVKSKNLILRGDSISTGKKYTYTIEISRDSLFTWDSLIARRDSLISPELAFPEFNRYKVNRSYYWRIAADNELSGDGRFSEKRKFFINNKTGKVHGALQARKASGGVVSGNMVADTAFLILRSSVPPYLALDTSEIYVLDDGLIADEDVFSIVEDGSYYLTIKHRNSIETWSSLPVSIQDDVYFNYDFTSSQSQAYGNNLTDVGGDWCFYSGDVNQDGTIDASDLALIDNDAYNFGSGYLNTDLNGDGFVDGTDFAVADNNAANFVSVIVP